MKFRIKDTNMLKVKKVVKYAIQTAAKKVVTLISDKIDFIKNCYQRQGSIFYSNKRIILPRYIITINIRAPNSKDQKYMKQKLNSMGKQTVQQKSRLQNSTLNNGQNN